HHFTSHAAYVLVNKINYNPHGALVSRFPGGMAMSNIVGDADAVMLDRIGGKLMIGLVVPIALVSFINAIDRVNLSYAGHAMSGDLGLAPDQFGLGISMFFIAYLIFQYPHARLLRVLG